MIAYSDFNLRQTVKLLLWIRRPLTISQMDQLGPLAPQLKSQGGASVLGEEIARYLH